MIGNSHPVPLRAALTASLRTRIVLMLIQVAILSNAHFFLRGTSGAVSYILATLVAVTAILALKEACALVASALGRRIRLTGFTHLALAAGAVMATLVLLETALQVLAGFQNPEDKSGVLNAVAMLAGWERRPVQIEGAKEAYYWHNVLHVHNRDRMRLVGEFPAKQAGRFRIIAVGDSLTYGYGVAEQDTYPRTLERELGQSFRVEVLNLGVSGAQSEDIHRTLRRKVPELQPDLVFYGMCLNDFLPSNVGEYQGGRGYQVPLPYKEHFIRKTFTGKLLDKHYDALLMRWGLRADFFTDILRDFDGYQRRFARDARVMNAFVAERGLPPMVAMVLDQYPNTREARYQIVLAAERHLRDAGIRVIPTEYIRRNDGRRDWSVSPWEGHPNEKAHQVFAQEIAKALRDLPELKPYRRDKAAAGS